MESLVYLLVLFVGSLTTPFLDVSQKPSCQEANVIWRRLMNEQPQNINASYLESAITLTGKSQIISHNEDRMTYLKPLVGVEGNIKSVNNVICTEAAENTIFEISQVELKKGPIYVQFVIWHFQNGLFFRALDFMAPLIPQPADMPGIQEARQQWIAYSADQEFDKLVRSIYTPNSIYYNNQSMLTGAEAIIEAFQLLQEKDNPLRLKPIVMQPVRSDMVIEMGQCKGDNSNNYIFIWHQDDQGKWSIWFDSRA